MSAEERLRGLLQLTRPGNAIAAGVLTFVGAFATVGGGVASVDAAALETAAAIGATVCATGAGNAINDYFDREIDAINRPDRPIPRGAVSARGALAFSVGLFLAALVLVLSLPRLALAIAVVNVLALLAYTEVFKGLPGVGNVVVAYLIGSTFLFGAAAVGELLSDPLVPLVLFLLSGVATVAREIIKDVEDVAGDREEGLNTLPLAIGRRRALSLGAVALVLAVLASPLPYLQGAFGVAYLAVVVPADAVMLYAMAESFDDPSAGASHIKLGMFLAAAAFVVGRLAVLA